MKLAPSAIQTQHNILEPLEDWYHPSSNVLILGEAAHLLNVSANVYLNSVLLIVRLAWWFTWDFNGN